MDSAANSAGFPLSLGESFTIKDRWDNLFRVCFRRRQSFAFEDDVKHRLESHFGGLVQSPNLENGSGWFAHAQSKDFHDCFSRADIKEIVADIRMQFLGLGYIMIQGDRWDLTERGAVHAATLFGKLRTS